MNPVLGRSATGSLRAEEIDTWPAPNVDVVTIAGNELQAVCPVTGQPDTYGLTIEYRPHLAILESKALKMYLVGFRNRGISGEALTAQIADDLFVLLNCPVAVSTRQQVRGGLSITAQAARS